MVRRSFRDDGVCLLKILTMQASSYEFMAESSRQGSTAYWSKSIIKIERKYCRTKEDNFILCILARYSMEYAAQNKSVFNTLFLGADKKAGIVNPGVTFGTFIY